MAGYIAKPTQEDVERIVRREFPPELVDEVFTALQENTIAYESLYSRFWGQEWAKGMPRVHAACIYLSSGNFESLKRQLAVSRQDFRDVVGIAEMCGEERYEAWLNETRPHTVRHPTHEDVDVIVRREFPPEVVGEVFRALRSIRRSELAARDQAACIKLASGSVAALKELLAVTGGLSILGIEARWDRKPYEAWLYHGNSQTIRYPTHEDVDVIVRRDFPPEIVGEVFELLRSIRKSELAPRIQAACIRKANGDVEKLKNLLRMSRTFSSILGEEFNWDREEYEAWLYGGEKR